VAEGEIKVRELDYNEILALGIDPTDPANRHVFVYNVATRYKEGKDGFAIEIFRNAYGDLITDNKKSGFHETYNLDGVKIWELHNNETVYKHEGFGRISAGEYYERTKDMKIVAAMSITTNLTWLKGFYSVDLTIMNNADEDFYIDHALANITLPEGLSLANTTDVNGATKNMGKIAGGETKVISWTVRGDKAGSYDVSAHFTGSLEPFGVPIDIEFKTENPVVVEAGNALLLDVVHELWSPSNDVWTIDYKLTNVSEKPVYDIQFELIVNYAYQCKMDIEGITINYVNREGPDIITWKDGKPNLDDIERWFNPLTEDIPDSTINLYPGEYLEFTVKVTKE
jgi:hypothetical protein